MDQIPSSAFFAIGQKLFTAPASIPIPIPIPILELTKIDDDLSTYDILHQWANLLIEYFGEYM